MPAFVLFLIITYALGRRSKLAKRNLASTTLELVRLDDSASMPKFNGNVKKGNNSRNVSSARREKRKKSEKEREKKKKKEKENDQCSALASKKSLRTNEKKRLRTKEEGNKKEKRKTR